MASLKLVDNLISGSTSTFHQITQISTQSHPVIDDESNRIISDEKEEANPYNADATVNLYIHFHYSNEVYFNVPNYPKAVAQIAINNTPPEQRLRALDLGCATGRTSFELAKEFKHVTGIDYAQRLIDVAVEFQKNKKLEWTVCNHGDIMDSFNCSTQELGLSDEMLNRIEFAKGDAHKLLAQYTDYNVVVACNLIDRLHSPLLFLENVHRILAQNGILILLDPYTWLEEYTEKNKWIGAKYIDNAPVSTFDALKKVLAPTFDFIKEQDVPFVIRETARKYQHTLAHCTVWKKK